MHYNIKDNEKYLNLCVRPYIGDVIPVKIKHLDDNKNLAFVIAGNIRNFLTDHIFDNFKEFVNHFIRNRYHVKLFFCIDTVYKAWDRSDWHYRNYKNRGLFLTEDIAYNYHLKKEIELKSLNETFNEKIESLNIPFECEFYNSDNYKLHSRSVQYELLNKAYGMVNNDDVEYNRVIKIRPDLLYKSEIYNMLSRNWDEFNFSWDFSFFCNFNILKFLIENLDFESYVDEFSKFEENSDDRLNTMHHIYPIFLERNGITTRRIDYCLFRHVF